MSRLRRALVGFPTATNDLWRAAKRTAIFAKKPAISPLLALTVTKYPQNRSQIACQRSETMQSSIGLMVPPFLAIPGSPIKRTIQGSLSEVRVRTNASASASVAAIVVLVAMIALPVRAVDLDPRVYAGMIAHVFACRSPIMPRDMMVARLRHEFGEQKVASLYLSPLAVAELYINRIRGSWTILRSSPYHQTCIAESGTYLGVAGLDDV